MWHVRKGRGPFNSLLSATGQFGLPTDNIVQDIENLSTKFEAQSMLGVLVKSFGEQLKERADASVAQAITSIIKLLTNCLPYYQRDVIHSTADLPEEVGVAFSPSAGPNSGNSILHFVVSLCERIF
jgi:hypothetical protein